MKYFRMSYEEVVFKRSYINIMLLNRAIPSYKTDKDRKANGELDTEDEAKDRKMHSSEFFMQFM